MSHGEGSEADFAVTSPLLTTALTPAFDAYVTAKRKGSTGSEREQTGVNAMAQDLPGLLSQLPSAHWFLLADLGESSP